MPILGFVSFALGLPAAAVIFTVLGSVLRDLEFPASLDPIVLSEEEGVEKPSPDLYRRALAVVNAQNQRNAIVPAQCLHVGDEIDAYLALSFDVFFNSLIFLHRDYRGAQAAGMNALLLRHGNADSEQAHKSPKELEGDVTMVTNLRDVLAWVTAHNNAI